MWEPLLLSLAESLLAYSEGRLSDVPFPSSLVLLAVGSLARRSLGEGHSLDSLESVQAAVAALLVDVDAARP